MAKAKQPQLSDDELLEKALRQREAKARAAAALKEAAELQDELVAEVLRRKSTVKTSKGNDAPGCSVQGIRVLVLNNTTTTYSVTKARKRLGAYRFRKLAIWVITKKAIDAALESGLVDQDDVDDFAETSTSSPYIGVYGQRT